MSVYVDDADDGVLLDLNAQVGPYGATVNGALGLLPDATLLGQHPAPGGIDRGVTRLQAFKWVQEFTGIITMRIGGTDRIVNDLGELVPSIYATCRALVQTATASRIETARGRQEYGQWLWGQWEQGVTDLLKFVDDKLGDAPDDSINGLSFSFPRTQWPDGCWPQW